MGGFTAALQKFGIGRLAAVLGVAAGGVAQAPDRRADGLACGHGCSEALGARVQAQVDEACHGVLHGSTQTDAQGQLVEPLWLAKAENVHRQLRPRLCADYPANLARVFAGGARMAVAAKDGAVLGVAGARRLTAGSER